MPGFAEFYRLLKQNLSIAGKSPSTLSNYSRYLAKIALYFECVPTTVGQQQLNDYLYLMQQQYPSASASYFKLTVYALRFALHTEGIPHQIILPSIKNPKTLPVVLSRNEMRRILGAVKLNKHKILLMLLYGCGLRCGEVRNIKLEDLDFDRRLLHVKCGKGRKDRYVPMNKMMISEIRKYIRKESCYEWLFHAKPNGRAGGDFDSRYANRSIQWAVKQAGKSAGILKRLSPHTLRHTFATHLLEDGLDILSIKELLGHSRIETTLIYLHVAQYDRNRSFSPLDTLYGEREQSLVMHHCPFWNQKENFKNDVA